MLPRPVFSVLLPAMLSLSLLGATAGPGACATGAKRTADAATLLPLPPAEQAFAQTVSTERGIPLAHIAALLRDARYNARVAQLIQPARADTRQNGAAQRRSWSAYRQRFVGGVRVLKGVLFWQQHRVALDAAHQQYGVPASIVVAIIGVETLYGQHTGNFAVLDTLYTLAFHHPEPARPARVALFREQLADLMELDYAHQLDARRSKGSFAGALGLAQFMPGSIRRFARDGDADGRIDLSTSAADAIASVANFLREHGWQPSLPVFAPVTLPDDVHNLLTHGLQATLDWPALQAAGASLDKTEETLQASATWQSHPLGVIALVEEGATENTTQPPTQTPTQPLTQYRVATPNFYALTHYNRSYFYAAAVADLAQALEAAQALAKTAAQTTEVKTLDPP